MHKFTKAGTVQKISGTNNWIVKEPFFWWIDYETKNERIIVHQGFKTDFGSVPRLLWFLFNPTEWTAYILHDWCYKNNYRSRETSDYILYQALIAEGCNTISATLIYYTLRLFGWLAWNNYKKLLLSK